MMVSPPTNNKGWFLISYHYITNENSKPFNFQTNKPKIKIRKLVVIIVGFMSRQKIKLLRLTFIPEIPKL